MRCAPGLAEIAAEIAPCEPISINPRLDAANAAANAIAGLRRDVVPWQDTTTAMVTWRPQRRRS